MSIENEQLQAEATPENVQQEAAPQVVDLDGVSRFTFQGQEYTPDQWSKLFSEHKQYSRQFESQNKESIYWNNLAIDLKNVRRDPKLAEVFRSRYPEKFHSYLDAILDEQPQENQQAPTNGVTSAIPREFLDRFGQLEHGYKSLQERLYQADVKASRAELDQTLNPLFEKFPLANEDQVLTRAEALFNQNSDNPDFKITAKNWERMVRESHEAWEKKSSGYHAAKAKQQLDKGKEGKDMASGGGTPGQAPVKPRTMDEAREAMIASLQRR